MTRVNAAISFPKKPKKKTVPNPKPKPRNRSRRLATDVCIDNLESLFNYCMKHSGSQEVAKLRDTVTEFFNFLCHVTEMFNACKRHGSVVEMGKGLGISRHTVYQRLKLLEIEYQALKTAASIDELILRNAILFDLVEAVEILVKLVDDPPQLNRWPRLLVGSKRKNRFLND